MQRADILVGAGLDALESLGRIVGGADHDHRDQACALVALQLRTELDRALARLYYVADSFEEQLSDIVHATRLNKDDGYLFLRHAIDKKSYSEISRVRGMVRVLGERWDCLARIPDEEMESIEHIVRMRQPVLPYPYLKAGRRARIIAGPLSGLEGILVKSRPDKGLLVLSVHLLQRSVAISVDVTAVAPA